MLSASSRNSFPPSLREVRSETRHCRQTPPASLSCGKKRHTTRSEKGQRHVIVNIVKKVRLYCRYSEKGHRHFIADTVKKVRDTSLQTQLAFVNVEKKATKKKVRDNQITETETDRQTDRQTVRQSDRQRQ